MSTWDDKKTYLVVVIDFGTTFSGVAWALSTNPKDIDVITEWNSDIDHINGSSKVPTSIWYSKEGGSMAWGFDQLDSDPTHVKVSWFKLLLCKEAKTRAASRHLFLRNLEEDLRSLGKVPVDVVADYLYELWSLAESVFESRFGKEFYKELPIKIILTVPALWDHSAQDLTMKAAAKAGITARNLVKLELVSEPEAAARYVFNEHLSLDVGDCFVVCDAGGGTIDLISYKVAQLDPVRLEMCTPATGDLFGAIYLDRAFEKFVRNKIGVNVFDTLSPRAKCKLLSDWEYGSVVIPGYAGYSSHYAVAAPAISRASSTILNPQTAGSSIISFGLSSLTPSGAPASTPEEPGVLNLKTTELELIYREVCPRIVGLVQEQIGMLKRNSGSSPKAIFLVGGFGSNRYLKEELQLHFPGVEIQQPRDASICRGAVLKGMSDETVVNHISKYHYGIEYETEFIPGVHLSVDADWDDIECKLMAGKQMTWYLNKGQSVPKNDIVTFSYYLTVLNSDDLRNRKSTIKYCPSRNAPERKVGNVKTLCVITSNFDPKIFNTLPEYTNMYGIKYRRMEFSIEMKVSSSGLDWMTRFRGEEYGRTAVAIDYSDDTTSSG